MNATTASHLMDEATATGHLGKARDELIEARAYADSRMKHLRDILVDIRPKGLLTVTEMAEAIGKDRNYVDSVWSVYGKTVKGSQTRVPVTEATSAEQAREAYEQLKDAAEIQRTAASNYDTAKALRDQMVTMIYGSGILGPSDISRAVGIDRNHVLRIARKAGVKPVHRTDSRNQYTQPASA